MRHLPGFWRVHLSLGVLLLLAFAQQALPEAMRPFTVRDEIGIAYFGNPYMAGVSAIAGSPSGTLAAVQIERGLVEENRVQDEVRIYSLPALRHFANEPGQGGYPQPLWAIVKNTYKEGPIISDLRWLSNSTNIAFLLKIENGRNQLWFGDVEKKILNALTPADQDVTSFQDGQPSPRPSPRHPRAARVQLR